MKKQFFAIALSMMIVIPLFAGCGKVKPTEGTMKTSVSLTVGSFSGLTSSTTTKTSTSVAVAEDPTLLETKEEANAKAEQAYMDFLNGKTKLLTSKKFQEDDSRTNLDGLLYGKYSYEGLKAAIAEHEGHASRTRYTFFDFGPDGVNELVLKFENVEPGFLNWVGIVRYNGKGLDLNYYYEDGYRIFSTLYTSGYLQIGGAIGAGGSLSTIVGFDGNGIGTDVFTQKELHGSFASNIVYDLRDDGSGLSEDYGDISAVSDLLVLEYLAAGKVKISVSGWSANSAVRAREEGLIGELVHLGAKQVSEEEIKKLTSLTPYEAQELSWLKWGIDPTDSGGKGDRVDAVISADYAAEGLLVQPASFYEFIADESEHQVKVVFSTDYKVTDVRVLALNVEEMSESGEVVFSAKELYSLAVLSSEKPLVVGMAFWGSVPNMGISYVDGGGVKRMCAISMSGLDGKLLLSEVQIK